jgi:hypothetical protein
MDEVKRARKSLVKEHGKGVKRAVLENVREAEKKIAPLIAEGEFAKAVATLTKAAGRSDPPEALARRLERSRNSIREAASSELASLRAESEKDPAGAARKLRKLLRKLRGTGLEDEAKALLGTLAAR